MALGSIDPVTGAVTTVPGAKAIDCGKPLLAVHFDVVFDRVKTES